MNESGPDHSKVFEAEVKCNGKQLATGKGTSKKAAEMEAAKICTQTDEKTDQRRRNQNKTIQKISHWKGF